MKATARIVAVAGRDGATVLACLQGEPPLLPRATGDRGGAVAQVHLVGGAAGPLGGDDLHLSIEVGPGASLVVRTVAATIALPGPDGSPSSSTVEIAVADGGRLAFLPEPVIAAARCDHQARSTVELEEGAQLVWREELVAGRWGEAPGRLSQHTRLSYAGTPALAQQVTVDDAWASPAIGGGSRTAGNLVVCGPDAAQCAPATEGATADTGFAARMPLAGPLALCTAMAPDSRTVRHLLASLAPPSWLSTRESELSLR
jgi:urease accessory protein